MGYLIIESVDSNVGIARTRNIWQYIKISPNLKNGELIAKPLWQHTVHLRVFSWPTRLPMARESITKVPNQTAAKRPNCFSSSSSSFFLSFFLSSDGLAQYCVNLSRWFTHETAAFSTEQCTTPSLFHNFEATHLNTTASNLGRHFLYLYLRMRT